MIAYTRIYTAIVVVVVVVVVAFLLPVHRARDTNNAKVFFAVLPPLSRPFAPHEY